VQDASWSANGDSMAIVRYVPENSHWRLEYPIGKVLLDGIAWISHPQVSPDGKWVAFLDHETPGGDDHGSVAVIGSDGKEKKLTSGFVSLEGLMWAPSGDKLWFTGNRAGSAENLTEVSLAGKERPITNVPGGMWLQDIRNGVALMITHQIRIGIRGLAPGAKEERELGWFGWSIARDISRDGKKVLFEEEGDGGGADYTVFLRDTDGSPPVRIGTGLGLAIAPDNKWVITKSARETALSVIPTGAGEARQLTHDNISYSSVRYLPDGKHLLGNGIEPGHGSRNYLIDLSTGEAKAISPEGVSGTILSPDGKRAAVVGPDGKWGVWSLEGGDLKPIPGLDTKYYVTGWTPDGTSLYTLSGHSRDRTATVYRTNVTTGKMELWKTFGEGAKVGVTGVGGPLFSSDGSAYVYVYSQALSVAYVVKGLK
jgi:WD40 repeat protein